MDDAVERLFRSHVENCLKSLWAQRELCTDARGDFPYERDGILSTIGVRGRHVRVFAVAAADLRRTAKVLAEINEHNAASWWTRTYWHEGEVVVEVTMPWPLVEVGSLGFSIDEVTDAVARIGPLLTAVHGGRAAQPAGVV